MTLKLGWNGWIRSWRMAGGHALALRVMPSCVVLLLISAAVVTAGAENPPVAKRAPAVREVHPAKGSSPAAQHEPESLAVPESIQLKDGQLVPVAEIIPRTEAAQKDLQEIIDKVASSDVETLDSTLKVLNAKVDDSLQSTESSIRLARSPLQLTEPSIAWTRDRAELETLNTLVTKHASALETLRQHARDLGSTWDEMADASMKAKLPAELVFRVVGVQSMADSARAALRAEAEKLIQVQVQISDTRVKIEKVIDEINAADSALRQQLWSIDSPPLWNARRTSSWSTLKGEMSIYLAGFESRTSRFLQATKSFLIIYGLMGFVVWAIVLRASKRDLSDEDLGVSARFFACLQHPLAVTFLIVLVLFGVLFRSAPPDLVRFSRMFMGIPVVLIGFSFVEKRMRPFLVSVAVFFVVDMLSLEFFGGTLIRRWILFLQTGLLFAGAIYLLRKRGMLRALLNERGQALNLIFCYLAAFLLLVATVANLVGNLSMAVWLGDGTIVSMYWAICVYVLCAVTLSLSAVFTVSDLGRKSRALRLHGALVTRKIAFYLIAVCWLVWIATALLAYQVSTQAVEAGREVLYYKWQLGSISLSLFDVVLFGLVLIVSNILARFIRFMLNEELLPRTRLDSGVAQAGSRLTYSGMLIAGVVLAFAAAGLQLSKLSVLTGAFGVGLGFGLQTLVVNFVSGIIISLERPMKIGDLIEVSNLSGEVTEIGFRSSTVHTFEGADVIVPNSEFVTKSFVNWSFKEKLRRTDILIGVAYGTDPLRVLEILTRIVGCHPGVLRAFPPLITFDEFGASSLNFTIRFWSKIDDRLRIRSELNVQINEEFKKNEIVIPFPQSDVHVNLVGDASGMTLPQSKIADETSA